MAFSLEIRTNMSPRFIRAAARVYSKRDRIHVWNALTVAAASEALKYYQRGGVGHGDRRGVTRRSARVVPGTRRYPTHILWDDLEAAPVDILSTTGGKTRNYTPTGFLEDMLRYSKSAAKRAMEKDGGAAIRRAADKTRASLAREPMRKI